MTNANIKQLDQGLKDFEFLASVECSFNLNCFNNLKQFRNCPSQILALNIEKSCKLKII